MKLNAATDVAAELPEADARRGHVVAVIPIAGRPLLEVGRDLARMGRAFEHMHVRPTSDGMGWEVVDLG